MSDISKLALGTVQFGIPYGVANQRGQIALEEAKEILITAKSAGIDTLDTAIAYGNSEEILGKIGVQSWRVISKLPVIPTATPDLETWVQESVAGSLKRLKISQLHGLLLHRPQQLLEDKSQDIYTALVKLKEKKQVQKIGISIYNPDDLNKLFDRFSFDIVQVPFNVLDRRLEQSGWLCRLNKAGIEVHIRSIFLQGLLLMNPGDRPPYFEPWASLWQIWQRWLQETGLTPLQTCLSYVLSKSDIDRVIVGVETVAQLQEIVTATTAKYVTLPDDLCCDDPNLINPARWQL